MINKKPGSLFAILKESPFFTELSIKEREAIVNDLLGAYPQLSDQSSCDDEMGYEASWLMQKNI